MSIAGKQITTSARIPEVNQKTIALALQAAMDDKRMRLHIQSGDHRFTEIQQRARNHPDPPIERGGRMFCLEAMKWEQELRILEMMGRI